MNRSHLEVMSALDRAGPLTAKQVREDLRERGIRLTRLGCRWTIRDLAEAEAVVRIERGWRLTLNGYKLMLNMQKPRPPSREPIDWGAGDVW